MQEIDFPLQLITNEGPVEVAEKIIKGDGVSVGRDGRLIPAASAPRDGIILGKAPRNYEPGEMLMIQFGPFGCKIAPLREPKPSSSAR